MPAYLRIVHGKIPVSRFDLPPDRPVIIGRGEGCDLRFEERSLSRRHCSIEREPDGWHLVDSKSTNGTRVGGFKVSDTVLASGELIQIGDVRIEFIADNVQHGATTESAETPRYPLSGRHFGRFELLERIHASRSGTLYHAREVEKNREVALKLVGADLAAQDGALQRFERGIHAAAPLHHSGIVQHFATGKTDGLLWLSMEWVDGPSVRGLLAKQKSLGPLDAVRIIRGVAEAAEVAAQHGIVHRNIHPSSILIESDGTTKLGDFVLARSVTQDSEEAITKTGEIVGDVEYLAPECFRSSGEVDCRADVYSLGVCLYHILTGQPPFRAPNISRLMDRALKDSPLSPRLLNPSVSAELDQIILKCLAKDRENRFQTPQQLADALAALGDQQSEPCPAGSEPSSTESEPSLADEEPAVAPAAESGKLLPLVTVSESPVSLPSSAEPVSETLKPPVILPKPSEAPAPSPWGTLIATIIIVVGVGSVLMFGGRAWLDHKRQREKEASATIKGADEVDSTSQDSGSKPATSSGRTAASGRAARDNEKPQTGDGGPRSGPTSRPRSKQLATALADPARFIVQPGTPLRNIPDAMEVAKDGQVIEVVSNDAFRGEIKLPPKSVHLVANPDFHPVLRNTVRVSGGGIVRIEGFHFEPYAANKPAIQVDKMPEKLELVGCTFRSTEGVLIAVAAAVGKSASKPQLTLERSFVVGNIVFGLSDLPPDLRLVNTCVVADQSLIEWQLSLSGSARDSRFGVLLRNNTITARAVFTVHLDDQAKPVAELPKTSIRLDDNIFAFPAQYPSTFFRWESWQQPDVALDRFDWSGSNNAFSGLGTWSMASTVAASDPAATAQVFLKTADEWKDQWGEQVSNILLLPPEFKYTGSPKDPMEIEPGDYELAEKSKQRELGTNKKPLGADLRSLPTPHLPKKHGRSLRGRTSAGDGSRLLWGEAV